MLKNKKNLFKILELIPIFVFVFLISYRDSRLPQRVIDGGLFISNQIKYESNSLMYESFSNSFTILHYFAAFLLELNLDLLLISYIFQLINLLIFSYAIYLINKFYNINIFLNYLCIFICLNAVPYLIKNLTFVYPLIVNSEHTYGQFGISISLFLIALVLHNKLKIFLVMIPLFLSTHLGWSLTTIFALFCYILLQKNKFSFKKNYLKSFLISVLFVLPFWFHYSLLKFKINSINGTANIANLYDLYVNNWDYHRSFNFDFNKFRLHLIILFVLLLILFLNFIFKIMKSDILIITILNSTIALILTYLDFEVFDKKFIALNSFMPGKIINLSLILYILIIFIFISSILDKTYKTNIFKLKNKFIFLSFSSFLLVTIFLLNIDKFNYKSLNLKNLNSYNTSQNKLTCNYLKKISTNILTVGNASRIIPLNCRKKILIDTTQIDFVPYSTESLPKLKQIMEEVYGIIFASRIDTSNMVMQPSIPIGGIDEKLVQKIWETRSIRTWEYLSCKYNFQYIVLPNNFKIQLKPILSDETLNLYSLTPNCSNVNEQFVGDLASSVPIEFSGDQFFYWQTDNFSTFYLRNINDKISTFKILMTFLPNPCKNIYDIEIKYNNRIFILTVGNTTTNFELLINSNVGKYQELEISLKSNNKECVINNEVRTLVTQISDIKIN